MGLCSGCIGIGGRERGSLGAAGLATHVFEFVKQARECVERTGITFAIGSAKWPAFRQSIFKFSHFFIQCCQQAARQISWALYRPTGERLVGRDH
jgi:hypothetical protein